MKKKAFTLAEVLITLAIIGVVAAMTIPTLINNYQKKMWTNQLKNDWSILANGFKLMLASERVDTLAQTEAFQSLSENGCSWTTEDCGEFYTNLGKYFKISEIKKLKNYKYNYLNYDHPEEYSDNAIKFANGFMLFNYNFNRNPIVSPYNVSCSEIKAKGSNFCYRTGYFYIDVNGENGPNIFGRDIYRIDIDMTGTLYPYRGIDFSIFYTGDDSIYWKNIDTWGCSEMAGKNHNGMGCAARIIENGWVMDY